MTDYDALARQYDAPERSEPTVRPHLVLASTVTPRSVRWLWHHRIARDKLTFIEGDPDLLKSTACLDWAARVSTGTSWPDGAPCEVAGVVICSAEDGAEDTIVPRLIAAGADLSRITLLNGLDVDGRYVPLTFPTYTAALRDAVASVQAQLIVIDPLAAFHDDTVNAWKDSDVRRMLLPLSELAEELGVAVVLTRHWNKGSSTNAKHKGGGSIAYTAAARAVFCVAEEPGDGAESHYVLAHVKHNLSPRMPSLRYRGEGAADGAVRIVWCGESAYRAPDLTEDAEKRAIVEDAMDALREVLGDGHPHPEQEVWREVKRRTGCSRATYKRARLRLGVKASPAGWQGPSMLRLVTPPYEQAEREGLRAE